MGRSAATAKPIGPTLFGMSFRHVPNFVRNSYVSMFVEIAFQQLEVNMTQRWWLKVSAPKEAQIYSHWSTLRLFTLR